MSASTYNTSSVLDVSFGHIRVVIGRRSEFMLAGFPAPAGSPTPAQWNSIRFVLRSVANDPVQTVNLQRWLAVHRLTDRSLLYALENGQYYVLVMESPAAIDHIKGKSDSIIADAATDAYFSRVSSGQKMIRFMEIAFKVALQSAKDDVIEALSPTAVAQAAVICAVCITALAVG